MAKQKQISPDDFSPEEVEQMQHYGQAMMHPPTDFDEEVEKHLAKYYPTSSVRRRCVRHRLGVLQLMRFLRKENKCRLF
jgi:hypothetical protein